MLNTPQQRHDSKPTQGKQAATQMGFCTLTKAVVFKATETATKTVTAAANRTSASVAHDGKVRQGKASLSCLKAPKSPIKASNAY